MNLTNDIVIEKAKALGFDLIGFAQIEDLAEETAHLKEWLEKGYHHKMNYLERNFDKRRNIRTLFADAKSVISLAVNYYTDDQYTEEKGLGKVSRYAWGKDYHLIIWEKLFELVEDLREIDPDFDAVSYVDTGPVMDKAWAVRAGIGWMGKHTNIISKELGSWFFIATVISNYKFDFNIPSQDFCGTCTACIDACPTDALIEEYVLDANKCISNLTIENRGKIPSLFKGKFDNWLFGCDICQDV
ncbi:tRNA epoxyqueuosine(34) reductase QueG, partial [Bacteroidota bacterium]